MIPFIDLKAQQDRIREDLNRRIQKVLEHGQYIMGPEVKELETALEQKTGKPAEIFASLGVNEVH